MSPLAWAALLGPVAALAAGFGLGWHLKALRDERKVSTATALVGRLGAENSRLRAALQRALDRFDDDRFDGVLEEIADSAGD